MAELITYIHNWINPVNKYEIKYGSYAIQGRRDHMEDTKRIVKIYLPNINTCYLVILCDGHAGEECSKFVVAELPNILQYTLEDISKTDDIIKSITKVIFELDNKFKKYNDSSGTTCVCGLFIDDIMYVINIGDSRCVIGNNTGVVLSTIDHKPSLEKEKTRILKNGGQVMNMDTSRVYINTNVYGLAISRVIGDLHYKGKQIVVCNPDIYKRQILQTDEFMILASDGLWDVITSEQASQFVRNHLANNKLSLTQISKKLVLHAYNIGSADNITVVICKIKYNN